MSSHPFHTGDFVQGFLFGDSRVTQDGGRRRADVFMDRRVEGWVGIPHGGIGMGAILELALSLGSFASGVESPYPLRVDFRMGGSPARVGDRATVEAFPAEGGAQGRISVGEGKAPYLTASMSNRKDDPGESDAMPICLPGNVAELEADLQPLPYYRNCFVCGVERAEPGLERKFQLLQGARDEKIVLSKIGFDSEDRETVLRFQRDGMLHPLPLVALIDETMGWAGFMLSASGGVTVRLSFTFHREIPAGQRVVVFGRGEKVRGSAGSRVLFWSTGGAAIAGNDGRLEPVITASGQWLGVPELTEQMKRELLPRELTRQAFEMAGGR